MSTAVSGLNRASEALDRSAQKVASAANAPDSGSETDDLTQGLLGQNVAAVTYKANATVVRTAEQMVGTLMSIIA